MAIKLTEEILKDKIASTLYTKLGEKTTVCLLTTTSGFEIVGTSACVDPEDFDMEIGKKYAFEKAFSKLWEVEGYLMQDNLWLEKHL